MNSQQGYNSTMDPTYDGQYGQPGHPGTQRGFNPAPAGAMSGQGQQTFDQPAAGYDGVPHRSFVGADPNARSGFGQGQPALDAAPGARHAADANTGHAYGAGVGQQGVGMGHGVGTHANPPGTAPGATAQKMVGRLEQAAGTVLSSQTLKARGAEKEREANAIKVQAAELAQAERLESNADAHRQAAVGHGAHPSHRHPTG